MENLTEQDLAMCIGCEAHLFNDTEFERVGKIEGVVIQNQSNSEYPVKVEYKPILDSKFVRHACYQLHEVKPILRPLSDMTEKEALKILQIHSCASDELFKERVNDSLGHKVGYYTYADAVKRGLSIGQAKEVKPVVIKFLISQSFDVFNWIKKGLAIDKTKI